ncbi:MAG: hypothetical protein RJA70_2045 [Pseudomonadota bacterium]|jgi:aspartyl-tRNA(Asn)/glutamyl-tRNA(Gln) amidotransferase subunit B
MTQYETVIGLEIHAQLQTQTKLFCACPLEVGKPPNTNVCPVCLGYPGALPVINAQAVTLAIRAALALNCQVHTESVFARKQYFYPDLPKGYQISQLDLPLATRGFLDIDVEGVSKRAEITRVHMEEDAGKNLHGLGGHSLVDLNRAGTPLIEIVGEPDLRSGEEAAAYMRAVRDILVAIGANDGNLEEGSLRCDVNISLRPLGQKEFGTRTELKNINSYRNVQRAVETEVNRQAAILDAGGKIVQETRGYDPDRNVTRTLRSKEDAHDYRYFPDPDLPPLKISEATIQAASGDLPELPAAKRARYQQVLGLAAGAAQTLTGHPEFALFFERTLTLGAEPVKAANWIQTEVLRGTETQGASAKFPVSPSQVASLLSLVDRGDISGKQAKEVYALIEHTDEDPAAVAKGKGLVVQRDGSVLEPLCMELFQQHPKAVAEYRAGKQGTIGFFVGQVMKRTQGSADPKLLNEILRKLLEAPE